MKARARQRGVILPVVLFVLLLLGLLVGMFAFRVTADVASTRVTAYRLQTRLAAEAGIERVKLLLRDARFDVNRWYNNPKELHRILLWVDGGDESVWATNEEFKGDVMSYRFSIVADDPTDDERFVRFGITDESSKINLNTATEEQLLMLVRAAVGDSQEVDPQEIVYAILDWRDRDNIALSRDLDTEGEYYRTLPKPYLVKNGPFDTVEELLLVKGITGQILYGEDYDRNGLLTGNEDDGDRSFPWFDNQDGRLNRGLHPYLTVLSAENNVANDNRPRVYLLGDDATVRKELTAVFPEEPEIVDYIVSATRPRGGSGSAGGGGQGGESGQGGSGQPGAGQPGAGQPGAGQPGAGQPGTVQPGSGQPGAGRRGASQPGSGQPGSGRPGTVQPGSGRPGSGQPGTQQPEAHAPGSGKPGPGKLGAGSLGQGQPGGQQPRSGQPGSGQPGSGRPGSGQSGSGQPGTGQPGAGAGTSTGAAGAGEEAGASGSTGEEGTQDPESADAAGGSEDEGDSGAAGETDGGGDGTTPIQTPVSLLREQTIAGQAQSSPLTLEHLPALLDRTTMVSPEKKKIEGLININTAPSLVLRCIKDLTPEQIEAILEVRERLDFATKATPAWLLSEGVVDFDTFEKIAPAITARGQQFRIESLGYADHVGMVTRLEVVVDMLGPIAETVYYRDLTYLGGHYPIREEDLEKVRAR